MSDFIPGLELSRLFFQEVVQPILSTYFPGLEYSAALIGSGSEVLGFDTEMSSDHHWGPRLLLFLREDNFEAKWASIHETLRHNLPYSFRGYSTNFGAPNPDDNNTRLQSTVESGPVEHMIEQYTLKGYFQGYLGFDLDDDITPTDWLTFPQQKLRTITAGALFHDEMGLGAIREKLAYYPQDVWLYLLACGWARIGQEEHLMPRAGYVGDELGSALIGSRLVRDIMMLCFLMEQQYAPYPKWFGTAFSRLTCAAEIAPHLRRAQFAESWQEREAHLTPAYEIVAQMHNALKITPPVKAKVSSFHGRPFRVIQGGDFDGAIRKQIHDPALRRLLDKPPIGSIDQFSDSTDLRESGHLRRALRRLYEDWS